MGSILSSFVIILMMLIILYAVRLTNKKSKKYFAKQQEDFSELKAYTMKLLSGQKILKAYNCEQDNILKFSDYNVTLSLSATDAMAFEDMVVPIVSSLSYAAYALVAMF